MAIPIAYNLRNLTVRKATTIMTALGIALTVAVLLAVLALVNGLRTAFESTGNPLNVIVLRKAANSELTSGMTREKYQDLKFKSGIARSPSGEPLTSLEMVTVINLPSAEVAGGFNVNLRGIEPHGIVLRDGLKIAQGRWFQAGRREVVVGKSIVERHPTAAFGKRLRFGKGEWDVVGVMDGGHSAINSEIFGDLNQISSDFNRSEALSSVLVRALDRASVAALVNALKDDVRLNVDAVPEKEYYDRQTAAGLPLQAMGIFVALIMAVGSCFAAMNTMYAAVARRSKEIGTLRVLGFSRGSILLSFFLESLLLSIIGGIIGILLVLPLNNVTTGITSFFTFSEIAFNFSVSPPVMTAGLIFALFMGALGGLFPARMAAKKEILNALRDI
jgi:putative ABC transport system permease protein